MGLSKQREKEKWARDLIVRALSEYHGAEPKLPEFTEERVPAGRYHLELTKEGIDEGIECLLLLNNMSEGPASQNAIVNLHQLLHYYLLDTDVRDRINDALFRTLEDSIKK